MGLRERFDEIRGNWLGLVIGKDYDLRRPGLSQAIQDYYLEAVCAEFHHDWPYDFVGTFTVGPTEPYPYSTISGPCRRCAKERS